MVEVQSCVKCNGEKMTDNVCQDHEGMSRRDL